MPFTKFTSHTTEARAQVQAATFKAVSDVFQIDMLEQAKIDTPVKTGTNKRSLDATVIQQEKGVEATMYSQSGYGGYLEVGTKNMKPQPYMYPAFEKFVKKIPLVVKQLLLKI